LMILTLAMYKSTSPETSELFWKVGIGTVGQFAFALLVWEHRWTWRKFTPFRHYSGRRRGFRVNM
jgi:hypothetical protein